MVCVVFDSRRRAATTKSGAKYRWLVFVGAGDRFMDEEKRGHVCDEQTIWLEKI